jgi:hypothetical protein
MKTVMQEIASNHVALNFCEISVRTFVMQQQVYVIRTPHAPYMLDKAGFTVQK